MVAAEIERNKAPKNLNSSVMGGNADRKNRVQWILKLILQICRHLSFCFSQMPTHLSVFETTVLHLKPQTTRCKFASRSSLRYLKEPFPPYLRSAVRFPTHASGIFDNSKVARWSRSKTISESCSLLKSGTAGITGCSGVNFNWCVQTNSGTATQENKERDPNGSGKGKMGVPIYRK